MLKELLKGVLTLAELGIKYMDKFEKDTERSYNRYSTKSNKILEGEARYLRDTPGKQAEKYALSRVLLERADKTKE